LVSHPEAPSSRPDFYNASLSSGPIDNRTFLTCIFHFQVRLSIGPTNIKVHSVVNRTHLDNFDTNFDILPYFCINSIAFIGSFPRRNTCRNRPGHSYLYITNPILQLSSFQDSLSYNAIPGFPSCPAPF